METGGLAASRSLPPPRRDERVCKRLTHAIVEFLWLGNPW